MDDALLVRFLTAPAPQALDALARLIADDLAGTGASSDLAEGAGALLRWRVDASTDTGEVSLALHLPAGTAHARVGLEQARETISAGRSVPGLLLATAVTDLLGEPAEAPETAAFDQARQAALVGRARVAQAEGLARLVEPPMLARAREVLDRRRAVGILGNSGSGKSVLAEMIGTGYQQRGHAVAVLDLGDPDVTTLGSLAALVGQPAGELTPSLVVLEDIQGNPAVASDLLRVLRGRGNAENGLQLLAVGWLDARDIVERTLGATRMVICDGRETCHRIVESTGLPPQERAHLLEITGHNTLVASIAVALRAQTGAMPDQSQIAERAYDVLTRSVELSPSELDALWLVSSLAMFEIDVDLRYVDVRTRAAIQSVLRGRLLRQRGDYVTFGHRTYARLVVRHLRERRLVDAGDTEEPVRLAVRYLRTTGGNQIRSTLDRLDLVAPETRGAGGGVAFLAEAWNSARILGRHLAREVEADPTWADNVASAVFAGEALAALGWVEQWRATAQYVRTRWTLEESEDLPTHSPGRTAESVDFVEIDKRMREEDQQRGLPPSQPAETIDLDRFHRTWVLGLLLGFEATAPEPDERRIAALHRMAKRSQAPDGSFYPPRVPWVTARVCLGLAAFGDTVATSPVLRDAVNWLRSTPPYGPYDNGLWQSGTGTWNTALMTSAMVLFSIGASGVGTEDQAVTAGLGNLLDARAEWERPGQELDCAQAVEAALVLGETWSDLADELRYLIQWARDSRSWEEAGLLATEIQDESCKAPYVSRALVTVVWETVRDELPALLERRAGQAAGSTQPALSTVDRAVVDRAEAALGRLTEFIVVQMSDRELLLTRGQHNREVEATWELWRERAVRCEKITRSIQSMRDRGSDGELLALIAEVDEFGREIQGNLWRPIAAG